MKTKFLKNVSWILFGNATHAVLQFLINVLAARSFSEVDYGLINYTSSIISIFNAICTLGFNGIIIKKFSEDEDKSGTYLWSGILSRLIISIPFVIISMIIVQIHAPENIILKKVMFCQALSLFFSSGDLLIYWYRYKYQANIVAIVRFASFLLMAVIRLLAIFKFTSVEIYVFATVCEVLVIAITLLVIYLKKRQPKFYFSFEAIKDMLKISYPFISSAILASIYGQTDKIMLESMIGTEYVAYYSVSLTLAGAISILPTALIEGFRPEILRFKGRNDDVYGLRLRQLYCIVFWVCIAYGIFITFFDRPIIIWLYGEKYLPAVPALSLIVWYTSFSYFGSINNIYMVAEDKTKWVQIIALIGAVINIILNYFLIPVWGICGAALASLMTQVLANFLLIWIIYPLRECFKLLVGGICFQKVGLLKNRKR